MTEQARAVFEQLQKIAKRHNIKCRAIMVTGGRGWINFDQRDDNDYLIQLSIPGDFQEYKTVKQEVCDVLGTVNSVLSEEKDYGHRAYGFQRELYFIDKEKWEKQSKAEITTHSDNQKNTNIFVSGVTTGGNINVGNSGDIDNHNEQASGDKKWLGKAIVVAIVTAIISGIIAIGFTIVRQYLGLGS